VKRRHFLSAAAASAPVLLLATRLSAQSSAKKTVIGLLDGGERLQWWDAFRQQLLELGYVEGRTVSFESRYAKGNIELLPAMAKELIDLKVAVIITSGGAAAVAASRATRKIPIVMASGADQVSLGLVSSLARPGGNVTGVSSLPPDLMAKRFELLREVVPRSSRLAVLWHADNAPSMASVRELDASAARSRVALQSFGIRAADELAETFSAMTRQHVEAVVVVNSPLVFGERRTIVELALKHKVPAIYGSADYADVGGLLSYGPSYPELYRRAASYVDKILKGANPGDLPIEQPATFELVINAVTARALGIALSPAMRARANRVIQ
jgi:putative ABC transport system substrate-binding protein